MSETEPLQNPYEYMVSMSNNIDLLEAAEVDLALGSISSDSPDAANQAEQVLFFAEQGYRLHDDDPAWLDVFDRAFKKTLQIARQ